MIDVFWFSRLILRRATQPDPLLSDPIVQNSRSNGPSPVSAEPSLAAHSSAIECNSGGPQLSGEQWRASPPVPSRSLPLRVHASPNSLLSLCVCVCIVYICDLCTGRAAAASVCLTCRRPPRSLLTHLNCASSDPLDTHTHIHTHTRQKRPLLRTGQDFSCVHSSDQKECDSISRILN